MHSYLIHKFQKPIFVYIFLPSIREIQLNRYICFPVRFSMKHSFPSVFLQKGIIKGLFEGLVTRLFSVCYFLSETPVSDPLLLKATASSTYLHLPVSDSQLYLDLFLYKIDLFKNSLADREDFSSSRHWWPNSVRSRSTCSLAAPFPWVQSPCLVRPWSIQFI